MIDYVEGSGFGSDNFNTQGSGDGMIDSSEGSGHDSRSWFIKQGGPRLKPEQVKEEPEPNKKQRNVIRPPKENCNYFLY